MLSFTINNQTIEFATSSDLFSPKGLDIGTQLLIETLEKKDLKEQLDGKTILDWGCGWGVLSLWFGKSYPTAQIIGIDSDIGAVDVARQNVIHNKLNNVDIIASHGYSKLDNKTKLNLIVSNPPTHRGREVVEQMIAESFERLDANGSLAIVVESRLKPWVFKQMKQVFGECAISGRSKKHVVLISTKML